MTRHNTIDRPAASTLATMKDSLRKAMIARIRETRDENALITENAFARALCRTTPG